jgi:hypothetical protein
VVVLDGVSVEQSGKMEGEGSRGPTQPGHVVGREGDEGRPIGRVGATHVLSGGAREAERGGGGSRGAAKTGEERGVRGGEILRCGAPGTIPVGAVWIDSKLSNRFKWIQIQNQTCSNFIWSK